jgi:acyl-coenzyme A thioesterase PaaI-like protein
VIHAGRRIAVANSEVTDADGRRIAVATGSAMLLPGGHIAGAVAP